MLLPEPLISGKLVKRYKRFLADIELESGETVTAHCANSGSMRGLDTPGLPVLLSRSSNPRRKFPLTLELIWVGETWVGVNTLVPNRVAHEGILRGSFKELCGYEDVKPEASWRPGCRFDFKLVHGAETCFVEVKSVTLGDGRTARFPDAKTERGAKHLRELMTVVDSGARAVMLFLVHRGDCDRFSPAETIDPVYANLLRQAFAHGVEVLVYRSRIEPPRIAIERQLPFSLNA